MTETGKAPILETSGLGRSFGGLRAVHNVDLRVAENSVHALIGPNGAGKTTCFGLISKFIQPSTGSIRYRGRDITTLSPQEVARLGLVRSFQISATFPRLSLLENVTIALQRPLYGPLSFWRGTGGVRRLEERASELLASVGLFEERNATAGSLSYGRKRALELATTLALEPDLMLLDEPMAGVSIEDIGRLTELIRQVARNRTVLIVEHNLKVVAALADRVSVLARGEIMAEGSYAEVSKDSRVIEAYMGKTSVQR